MIDWAAVIRILLHQTPRTLEAPLYSTPIGFLPC